MKFKNYRNKYNDDDRIYSSEDVYNMSVGEAFNRKEELLSQNRQIGMPTPDELRSSGNVVWVSAYKRDDGTEVCSHWRSKSDSSTENNLGGGSEANDISDQGFKSNSNSNIVQEQPMMKASIIEEKYLTPIDNVLNDPELTQKEKEEKIYRIIQIQKQAEARNKEIEKEYRVNMAKIIGKEILPYIIPNMLPAKIVSGVNKITKPVIDKIMPRVGEAIKKKIGEDVSRSLLVSPISSVSEAIEEDKNIATTILKNTPKDVIGSGLLKYLKSRAVKNKNYENLNKNIESWNVRQQRKQVDKGVEYYNDYIKGTLEDDGYKKWWENFHKTKR